MLSFTHLGHILTSDLRDSSDIGYCQSGESLLRAFHAADPLVKCYLLKSYCLSLYGCSLWSLSSRRPPSELLK